MDIRLLRVGCLPFVTALLLCASPSRFRAQGIPAAPPSCPDCPVASAAGSDSAEPSDSPPVQPWPTNYYMAPLSRIGIGADVSPLGIGIKGAVNLNGYLDARLMQNFFSYDSGRFELSNVNVDANLRLRSTAASLDWYPFHSIWRLSIGSLFFNGNQITAATRIASGTSVRINGQTFYSADPNPATGATPLTGSGILGFHTHNPALTLSGGFGRFIARAGTHWTFPSDFGVAFTGPPTVNLNLAGWACLDKAQTQCASVGNPASPVAIQFNNAVQARLAKFRASVSGIQIYPLFSYSVVYSFKFR